MNERGYGWFYTGAVPSEVSLTEAEKPAVEKSEKPVVEEKEEDAGYGFARMSGATPKLSVVGKDGEPASEEHGVFYPKPDKTYIINKQIEGLFKILEASGKKCPQNVNLIGPHGCGKTELAIQFAARLNRPLLIMDCANLREARDWFGYKTAKEGTVYWHESQFVRAVQAGGHVILLDELNRANPNLLNTLMPILDARRFTYLEERGDKIIVGPETVFFASMNEGAGYTGTSALDRAIRDRFPRAVELTYLGESDETKLLTARTGVDKDIATRLVQMANKIRQDATGLSATLTESLSTRQLLAAAHDFALGGVDTLQFTITNHFSPDGDEDSERVKVQSLIQGKFGDLMAAQAAATAKKGA
jgi:nitric oxide reductase NorQ protein